MKTPSLAGSLFVVLAAVTLLAMGVGLAAVLTLRSVTREQGAALVEEAADMSAAQYLLVLSERRARYARSWLLTPEPHTRQGLEDTRQEWEAHLHRMQASFTNGVQREILERIQERQHVIQALVDRLISQREQGARVKDVELELERELLPLRVSLDQELARLVAHQEASLQEVVREQERTRLRAVTRLGLGMLGAMLITGVTGGLLVRSLRQHRRAEEAVLLSEARFRATFNHAAVGLAQVGLDGHWLLINQRYCDILGYSLEELHGRRFSEFTHPDDLDPGQVLIRQTLAGERAVFSMEKRYLRKGGSVVWVSLTVSLVRDMVGTPLYFLAVAEDITRRKALEEEREVLLAETREALRLREEFLSVASHELRTPLTPLSLKLQVLLREARAQLEQPFARRVVERLESGQQQVHRMTRLINELLDASHVGAGGLALRLEDVDLPALVHEVAQRFELVAVRAGCELRVDAEAPVVGQWDRRRLEQVVGSLLANALKFGAGRPVLLRVVADGEAALLLVRDEGIGITPEQLPHIFGRFSRGVSDRHYGGLGLGLFLTRYVVESLGGEVTAESTPGQGATFIVRLPLRAAEGRGGKGPGLGAPPASA